MQYQKKLLQQQKNFPLVIKIFDSILPIHYFFLRWFLKKNLQNKNRIAVLAPYNLRSFVTDHSHIKQLNPKLTLMNWNTKHLTKYKQAKSWNTEIKSIQPSSDKSSLSSVASSYKNKSYLFAWNEPNSSLSK